MSNIINDLEQKAILAWLTPLLKAWVGSLVRHVLTGLSVYLVTHHVLAGDQSASFMQQTAQLCLMLLPGALGQLWSLWDKSMVRVKILTALHLQGGASEAVLKATIDNGFGQSLKTIAGILVLLCLLPNVSSAQSTPFDAPFHPLPTANERKVADIASWGTVLADVALDAKASWDAPNRGRAFAMQGIRTVVTIGIDYGVKSLVGRQRPCAPSCGFDSPNSSFYSMHTALAFSTLGGPRLAFALPLAIGTGGLRIAAGKHYLTDVLVGAAAGALTSRIR